MRARKMREMTVELTPITDADVPAVAEFCAPTTMTEFLGSIMLGGAMEGGGT